MPTIYHEDLRNLTVSKIDIILDKVDGYLKKSKNPTSLAALNADKKRLVDAKSAIIKKFNKTKNDIDAKKRKGKFDEKNIPSWYKTWRTSLTYAKATGGKAGGFRDLNAKGADFFEDKKAAVIAIGATATTTLLAAQILNTKVGVNNEAIYAAIGEWIKTNPLIAAAIGTAGVTALLVSIPTIRNKIRNSEAYKGKMQAKRENADIKASIIDLNSTNPREVVDFYTDKSLKTNADGSLEIDPAIVDCAANNEVINTLREMLNDKKSNLAKTEETEEKENSTNGMSNDSTSRLTEIEKMKISALINQAELKILGIKAAAAKELTKSNNRLHLQSAVKTAATTFASQDNAREILTTIQKEIITLEQAIKDAEAALTSTPDDADAKNNLATAKTALDTYYGTAAGTLGINMENFKRDGVGMPLVSQAEAAKLVLEDLQNEYSLGNSK